jgi:O-antigen biosynthesis protein
MPANLIHKLRALLFSPDSKFELWARTIYHRVSQTKIFFNIQDWLAKRSYRKWLKKQESEPLPEISPAIKPTITFCLYSKHNQVEDLAVTLESIINLSDASPQVVLISPKPEKLEPITHNIKNNLDLKVISKDQINLLESIKGDFVIFCQAGDRFFPSLLKRFCLLLQRCPEVDLVYFDCEIWDSSQPNPTPVFKPPVPSATLCLSYNMLSRGIIRVARLKEIARQVNPRDDLCIKEYEVCLKLLESKAKIQHLPAVLVSQRQLVKPDSPETIQVVTNHLSRIGLQNPSATHSPIGTHFHWSHAEPSLTIVIPSQNNVRLLMPLIQSFRGFRQQFQLSINIVDNASDDPQTLAYYDKIKSEPNIHILPYRKPFNYSEAINLGAHESSSDLILLMNDDMAPLNPDWLPEMVQWALREDIGVVGAKLLRANHTLQHIGIILGLVGFAGHIYLNAPEDHFGLWGSANWIRELLAVTGACQMTRRSVFNEVDGYDEGFKLAFGDIDFCLRVHEQGYCNIVTPFARLYHYEGRSRGYVTPVGDILRGYEKFASYLIAEDPHFSPNLTYTRIPKCALSRTSSGERAEQITTRRGFYQNKM